MRSVVLATVVAVLMTACPPEPPQEPSGSTTNRSQDTVAEVFSALGEDQSPTWTRFGEDVDNEELGTFAGPGHCSWEEVAFLHLGWPPGTVSKTGRDFRQYIRDPEGVLEAELPDLDLAATLPDDAADTAYRLGDLQLWLAPSDANGAYLRLGNDVERWPRENPPIACA